MANFHCYLGIVLLFYCSLFIKLGICHKMYNSFPNLRLVSVLFRHGDRTVDKEMECYPNDPYKLYNFYPDGDGQLTNVGKERIYQFGSILKQLYNNFLGNVYYQPNVHARSSAIVRSKMSLQLVLAALYPPNNIQNWNWQQFPWQPTDFTYVSVDKDGLLFPIFCPAYAAAYKMLADDPIVKMKVNEFSDLMKITSKYTGQNITHIGNLFVLYHVLVVEASLGLKLPDWTQDILPDKLLKATLLGYDLLNYNDKLIQYSAGGLLYRIIDDMNKIINGTLTDRRINLFSGHDINMVAMLKALKIFDNRIPAYTSSIMIELRETNGDYFIRILRYLGIPTEIIEVNIPGCEKLCPYEKFLELTLASIRMDDDPTCPLMNKFTTEFGNVFKSL